MTTRLTPTEQRVVQREILRLNSKAWGIAVGLVLGLTLFVTTLILVIKGGPTIGPHLALLGVYLPGYRVTTVGAFIGLIYMFVIGYALGRGIGWVYNAVAFRG